MKRSLLFACNALILLLLASCATPPQFPTQSAPTSRTRQSDFARAVEERPGLGTAWGETRSSRIRPIGFQRANARRPIASARIYYNDAEGIRAMAGAVAWQRGWPLLPARVRSLVSVGLRDGSGRFLPGLAVGDRWFVVGEKGRRYSLAVRNQSEFRLEVVLSVDGLDVMDGRAASLSKRGYIVGPGQQIVVDGFRQSTEAVAAFRFSSVRDSYAQQKHGDTQNVGVIGVAIFNEMGTDPWSDSEIRRRLEADPFPGRFATPP